MTTLNFAQSHFFTLPNGLKIMHCPIEDASTSYVSMAVKAGHFYDPKSCEGLAHLLEHGLFLGSEQLPQPNSINDLIERHGGAINAWTGTEYANYHFHCHNVALPALLPAFADMLQTPLLNVEALSKEIQSIEAEFQFKRKDDLRRLYQIHKETCNPGHPFSKFSVGNASIFEQMPLSDLQAALKQHHEQYYCASNMALCIFSALPFEPLRELIAHTFGSVPAGKPAPDNWPPLYLDQHKGIQINIVPLQSARRMIVTFPLPALHNDFKVKPLDYISHLLGDEGEGSLLAYLKGRNWVTNLIAGSGIEGDDYKDFNVSFQLTGDGLNHRLEILEALFDYVRLIGESLDEPWRYQEKAKLHSLAYQHEENPKLMPLACDYAQHMFVFTFDEIKMLRSEPDSFDRATLEQALSLFNPDNIRVKTIAQGLPTDRQCKHYDACYGIDPLPDTVKAALYKPQRHSALYLPPPNPYLGTDYQLVAQEADYALPQKIKHQDGLACWFAQDHQFNSPKGDIYFSFDAEAFTQNLEAVAAKRIWLACLNDALQAKYYRAEIAGLHYRLYGHQAGFSLHTRGFTNQQMKLAAQLLSALHTEQPSREQFELRKAMQLQSLQNSLLNKPTNRLFSRMSVLIQRSTQAPIDLIKAVEKCSYEHMLMVSQQALDKYYLESFVHGNWTAAEATAFADDVAHANPNASGSPLSRQVSRLPAGTTLYHKVPSEHEDCAVVLYLQAPSSSLMDTVMCLVLEQILSAPFFNTLRTQKQLGYVVGTGYVPHNQHPGMSFYIQSPNHSPDHILSEITGFLFEQMQEVDFYRAYWETIQHNLLKQLEERDLSLSMKSQRLWISLGTADYEFNRNKQLAECVRGLSFNEIKTYANQIAERTLFGELVLFAAGKFDELDCSKGQRVDDIATFKNLTPCF